MASENNRLIQSALSPALKADGFKKSAATWRRANSETICVFNIQGSQWGPSFYLNLGVYFRSLGDNEQPAEYHCHLRVRLEELVSDRSRLIQLLNFESRVELSSRLSELKELVTNHGLPWLHAVSTISGAQHAVQSSATPAAWITAEARQLLAPNSSLKRTNQSLRD